MVLPINELSPVGRLRTCEKITTFDAQATASIDLFQVIGGQVYCEMFTGWVSTVIVSDGALTIFHQFTPDSAIGGLTALNTVLTITNDPVDTIYTTTGAVAIVAEEDGGLCLTPSFQTNHWILVPGVLNLNLTAGVDSDGVIVWTLVYRPMNDAAFVVAA